MRIEKVTAIAVTASLAACGGGSGSGTGVVNTGMTSSVPPSVSIHTSVAEQPPFVPLLATASTPNFTNSLPANGTIFPLTNAELDFTDTSVEADTHQRGGVLLSYKGTQTSNGDTVFVFQIIDNDLALPPNFTLPADGTQTTIGNAKGALALASLNYTFAGEWAYGPGNGTAYLGNFVGGFQTPTSNVPTSGTATYIGTGAGVGSPTAGGAVGQVFIPTGDGKITSGVVSGQANVSVNFGSGVVNGTLSNMTLTPQGGGSATPWNSVTLAGTIAGAGVQDATGGAIRGTTATSGAPSGAGSFGLSSTATGTFSGALYGPNGQELSAVWSLSEQDPTNGRAALGVISATKQ